MRPIRMPSLVASILLLAAAAASALDLAILDPKPGSILPSESPVVVQYAAKGGPFVYLVLLVDGVQVQAQGIASEAKDLKGEIAWDKPTTGLHTLVLQVFDSEKRLGAAQLTIDVGGKGAKGDRPVSPAAEVPVPTELTPARRQIILDTFRHEFGLALPSPPIARKFRFGVPDDPWVSVAYVGDWVYEVNLFANDSAETLAFALSPNAVAPAGVKSGGAVYLKPAGTLKMLVVFVDYGNLGVSRAEAQEALNRATADVNAMFAERSRAVGLSRPILRIDTDARFITPPAGFQENDYQLRAAQVRPLAGVDPAPYDILAQVDLDRASTARNWSQQKYGTASFGTALPSLAGGRDRMNIWVVIEDPRDLAAAGDDNRLIGTLLTHEVLHLMGYLGTRDIHAWPGGDGKQPDATDAAGFANWPTYLLGWTDTDGDGTVEILDPKPYGMK